METPSTQRRLRKFADNPYRYISAALGRRLRGRRATTYVIGFSTWKQVLRRYFADRELVFLPRDIPREEFDSRWRSEIVARPDAEIWVWGTKAPAFVFEFARERELQLVHVEDGFVRSVQSGASKAPPMSLCFDRRAPYFHAGEASDLETLLNDYDFAGNPKLLERADRAIALLLDSGVSKYNHARPVDLDALLGPRAAPRVLVLGQVEDDASIRYGSDRPLTNNDAVRQAAQENPGAQVIFKPHPEVLAKARPQRSRPEEVEHLCTVLRQDVPLAQVLQVVDRVYTISSLAGFEALLRGLPVTTLGCPFYAGWGLTDERQPQPRRRRKLALRELFAGAYLLYPKYFDADSGAPSTFEEVVSKLRSSVAASLASAPVPVPAVAALPPLSTAADAPAARPSAAAPYWLRPGMGVQLRSALQDSRPVFLYVPWIAEHGDSLIARIESPDYVLAAFDLVDGIENNDVRKDVLRYAREHPHRYRRMVARRLVPLARRISGVIFTFDWAPAMRLISAVCEDLGIARILVPHESVFVDRDKYYWDPTAQASVPRADLVLGWGELQCEIFTERGYPRERFVAVGAPKFDAYRDYRPQLTRAQFCRLFSLDPHRPIVLFASQPLDSQLDATTARASQRDAIGDLLDSAAALGAQLLVRLPPSKDDILGAELQQRLARSPHAAVDDAAYYVVAPEEALHHADLVTSVNSTMLFEGVLLGRPSLALKYVEFEQIWQRVGIPSVSSREALAARLPELLAGGDKPGAEGLDWAAHMFGNGAFDGAAAPRIRDRLKDIANGTAPLAPRPGALARLLSDNPEPIELIAIPSAQATWETSQRYLLQLLNARKRLDSRGGMDDITRLASVDLFVQWGITDNEGKQQQAEVQRALGVPQVIVEDGFIRSVDIGLSKEPGLSIIVDDTTAYYDATRVSRLQHLLESGPELDAAQCARSRAAIDKIVRCRVSKYNHAPDLPLSIGRPERRKVLLVDQRYGDQSVESGLADESSFERMLRDTIRERADWDIIVKQHPDAIKGGKASYYSAGRMAFARYMDNLHTVEFDVNPFSLLDLVDEVRVVTSGMGFEALMAGKAVHCYGMPFYAGWGLTQDRLKARGRTRRRSVEAVFHFAYIECSRYYHPLREQRVPVEELVDYIVGQRSG